MKTHNPDRVSRRKLPKGWRFLTSDELPLRRRLRLRIWEVGYWGPVITVRHLTGEFTAIRRA